MTIDEVTKKLVFEMVQLTGHFEDADVYKSYIRIALTVGMEYFNIFQDEVIATDQQGVEVGRYKSIIDASKKLNIPRQSICKVVLGYRNKAGGLSFRKSETF